MLEERSYLWATLAKSSTTVIVTPEESFVSFLKKIQIILQKLLKSNKQNENKKIIRTIDTRQKLAINLSERLI